MRAGRARRQLAAKQALASQQTSCDFDRRHMTVTQCAAPASRIAKGFGEISD
ncbi:hypothetical protein BSIN_2797 [Burkholderia singularis]|uniref:Uncharacterized protein n=1 Tax=Burkholderia singularis TaxID=1503053 RepID=A0A238H2Z6_9BURK|nr:hypothetical protein BSIN_2797 [Burkholderia singularis]